jgi:hypothetical protein
MSELIAKAGFHALKTLWDAAHAAMNVEIHNTCPYIELMEPLYFTDGAVCCMPLDQKITPGGTLRTAFRINLGRTKFEGALLYRLKKRGANSNQQPDIDTTNIDESWSNCVQLLVGWKLERFQDPRVYMLLIEHEEKFVWTDDKLKERQDDFRGRFNVHNGSVDNAWLMEDDSGLKLTLDSVGNREYGIKITISEIQNNTFASLPVWVEPKE